MVCNCWRYVYTAVVIFSTKSNEWMDSEKKDAEQNQDDDVENQVNNETNGEKDEEQLL